MGSRKLFLTFLFACLMGLSGYEAPAAQSAAQIVIQTDSALLSEPRADATVVAQLKKGTTGQQTGKQGMFLNVKTSAGTGWVYAFNVSVPPAGTSVGGGGRGGPNLSGKVAVTSTIGIRGLSAEDLRKAATDPQQLKLLDSYVASAEDGEAAASQAGLTAARVEYFK